MKKILFVMLFFLSSASLASPLEGLKKIYLVSTMGELTQIANVEFESNEKGVAYKVSMIDTPFENQFLSMRPFQCLMGKIQVMCHVPYPYEKKGYVTQSDFSNLSYDLLFLHKTPSEYGINMWNGIFYKLGLNNGELSGLVLEIDMNILAVPPDDLDEPIPEDEFFEADVTNYAYPRIVIK
ncbi:MAG: hypothetical protein A6F72_00840 [Cycloclasticus sp. symbiont of Poecilosclerida sp. N]|nr:MAG: hypothetical protein A6F72_00840 [Cycloclasticus sp. symbiont of Poecilosclerida sp. N]